MNPPLGPISNEPTEQRAEPRLRYQWSMYFQHPEDGRVEQGRMVDLSRSGAAFLADTGSDLWPGKQIDLRLTHPMLDKDRFSVLDVRQAAEVVRVEQHNDAQNHVAVLLSEPLAYDPVGARQGCCPAAVLA
jgi:hypothetical protein